MPTPDGPSADPVRAVVRRRRASIAGAAALLSSHQLGEAAVPVVVGAAIDDAVAGSHAGHLVAWLAVLAGVFATLSLSWRFGARRAASVRLGIAHDLRGLVVDRVLDPRGLDRPDDAGRLVSVAMSDTRRVAGSVRTLMSSAAGAVVLVGTLVLVARVSWLLAGVVLGGAVLSLLGVARASRPVETRSAVEQEAAGQAAGLAADLVAGLRVVAGLHAAPGAVARYRAASQAAVRGAVRSADAAGLVDALTALAAGGYLVLVAVVCAALGTRGDLSVGQVVAVLGLSQVVLGPLQACAAAWPAAARGLASARRVRDVLDAPTVLGGAGAPVVPGVPGVPGAPGVPGVPGAPGAPVALRLDAVRAGGLDGVSLRVEPGTLHGVLTGRAHDAEALVAVLGGERRVEAGRVRVGADDLAALDPDARRRAVLAWPHGAFPSGTTVGEVVGTGLAGTGPAGASDPAPAPVDAAAARDVLDRLPDGLAGRLGEGGATLSGGERQRVALARVLAEPADVLVLHEPTSALDPVTEAAVADGVARVRRGRTTVLVTSSPRLLAACDAVTLVDEGRAVATGTHASLRATEPRYRAAVAR